MVMNPALIFSLFVIAILAIAALNDIKNRKIPNALPIALALGFGVAVLLQPELRDVAIWRVAIAALAFAFGLAVYSAGVMGGGDVKLISALILWHPLSDVGALILSIGICGALVSLIYAAMEFASMRRAQTDGVDGSSTIAADMREALRTKVPYGVAILFGHIAATTLPLSI